jgi:predicted HicB family RNase H-like nuclease
MRETNRGATKSCGAFRWKTGYAMNAITYKGYEALVQYDEDAETFHGEAMNLRDVIAFQGASAAELKQALADSVDDYLEFCKQRGEEPEKP